MSRAVVIGGGIVGLWTAEVLSSRGHDVTVRTASPPESSYSSAAACVITPLLPWEPHQPEFLTAWGRYRRTIVKFRSVDESRDPRERFLEPMPSYECGFEVGGERFLEKGFNITKFNHLPFAKVDVIPLDPPIRVKNYVNDFQLCTFSTRFVADFCNTEVFLAWLKGELVRRRVKFEFEQVRLLDDLRSLRADVIFNCMGFDSQRIFPDETLYPIRGQSMFIDSDDPKEPFFGIASGHHAIFKHRRGFYLGSYFLETESVVHTHPQRTEYDISLEFANGPYRDLCHQLGFQVPQIDFSRIRRVNLGIRPYRPDGPRVEVDDVLASWAPKPLRVVHNYGHGAHGWTLGYATAEDAVNVAEVRGWLS